MQATLAPSSMGIALGARSLRMGGRALVAAPARPTQQIKGAVGGAAAVAEAL